jgi:hypothetical protein
METSMPWKVGNVQEIQTDINGFSGPGFVLQQEGHSPSLTMIFQDHKAATAARTAFVSIVDKAAVIVGK